MAREYDFLQSARPPGINEMTRARDLIKSQLPPGANAQPYVPEPSWAMQKYRENVPAHIRTYGEALFNATTGRPARMITEADFTPEELAEIERIVATDRDLQIKYTNQQLAALSKAPPYMGKENLRLAIKDEENALRKLNTGSFPVSSYHYSAAYDGMEPDGSEPERPSWGARPWGNTLGMFMVDKTPDGYVIRDTYDFANEPVHADRNQDYASMNPTGRFVAIMQDMKKGLYNAPGIAYLGDMKKAPRVSMRIRNLPRGQYSEYPVDPKAMD